MTFGSFFKIAPHITDQKMCRGKNYMQEIYILHIFFQKNIHLKRSMCYPRVLFMTCLSKILFGSLSKSN